MGKLKEVLTIVTDDGGTINDATRVLRSGLSGYADSVPRTYQNQLGFAQLVMEYGVLTGQVIPVVEEMVNWFPFDYVIPYRVLPGAAIQVLSRFNETDLFDRMFNWFYDAIEDGYIGNAVELAKLYPHRQEAYILNAFIGAYGNVEFMIEQAANEALFQKYAEEKGVI